jgi:hypothetical protein
MMNIYDDRRTHIYTPRTPFFKALRANIRETPVVLLINEQGEKEKGRDEWQFS